MTQNTHTEANDDAGVVTLGTVTDGRTIDLTWCEQSWTVVYYEGNIPTAICREIESILVDELGLPKSDEITADPMQGMINEYLDTWVAEPKANPHRSVGIDDVAEISVEDGEWTVDVADRGDMRIIG